MRRRIAWTAACAALVVLGPRLPGWLTAAGLDAWNAPALQRQVAANLREQARLGGEIADVRDEIQVKERLTEEFIAGRLTLADATDRFEELVAARPQVLTGLRCMYPEAATDRERVARHVIDYARSRLTDPDQRDHLSARMTTELQALFPAARPGTSTMG